MGEAADVDWTPAVIPEQSETGSPPQRLEAFIKARPLKPGTGGAGTIIMRADDRPGLDPYLLSPGGGGNVLQFQIQNSDNETARLTATIPYDQWLHVAGTLGDASGEMKLYINGTLDECPAARRT